MGSVPLRRLKVPSRIDFAGGWTDVPEFSHAHGGLVLNAAIDAYVEASVRWEEDGLELRYRLALPPDSHLGTSSSTNLAWLRLIYALIGEEPDPVTLAEKAYLLDGVVGEKGGKQDQYAAALGGINLLRFGAENAPARIEPVELAPDRLRALEDRLILCHSGPSQNSGDQHQGVWKRYRDGDRAVLRQLCAIRDTVEPARDALVAGDMPALGRLLTANREAARALGSGAVSPAMDRLFAAAGRAGALGGKPCGAGGGGVLLILAGDDRAAAERALEGNGGRILPFGFAPRVG